MLRLIGVVILSLIVVGLGGGCGSDDGLRTTTYPPRNDTSVTISEGIWGDVWFWEGDFMPPATGKVLPRSREVVVFELATQDDVTVADGPSYGFYSEVRTAELARTKSRWDGFFQVELPPGEYSVFVIEESLFYRAAANPYDKVSCVIIESGGVTDVRMDITYLASF